MLLKFYHVYIIFQYYEYQARGIVIKWTLFYLFFILNILRINKMFVLVPFKYFNSSICFFNLHNSKFVALVTCFYKFYVF